MTEPEAAIRTAREAREQLYTTARWCQRRGDDPHTWLEYGAAQWALDAVTQREVDAVIADVWGHRVTRERVEEE